MRAGEGMRILAWVATLAVVLGSAPAALASHMSQYAYNPVEHDDQGRGLEPDGRSTSVLGPVVGNRVVDLDGDGRAEPDAALPAPPPGRTQELNPGCWGDDGRKESGRCGLWTVGLGGSAAGTTVRPLPPQLVPWPVSEDGRCQGPGPVSFPPGRLSGGCGAALRAVMFLDAVHHSCASASGVHYVEVNRKVDDAAARAAALGLAVPSQDVLAGPVCIWAWYGTWMDKNGNGVIDAHADFNAPEPGGNCVAPCDGEPVARFFLQDEFVWHGACLKFGYPPVHNPASVRSGYCRLDREGTGTEMVGWLYPGNHHAYLGAFPLDPILCSLCFYEPVDLPGRQVIHFAGSVLYEASGGVTSGPCDVVYCEIQRDEIEAADGAYYGDPLLGPQDSVAVDQAFGDRSGDPALATRHWLYGVGWAAWMYDQSVLVRLVQVTGVGCPRGGPTTYVVASCRFADVDAFDALSPEAEDLLQGRLKPLLRSHWVFARDAWDPLMNNVDAVQHHRLLDAGAVAGPVEARALDPGFGREPNDPGDRFPGAVHNARGCLATPANGFADGERLHHGWCNDYAAHRAGPRAYADVREELIVAEVRSIVNNVCTIPCASIILATTTLDPVPPGDGTAALRAEGDHRRTFPPGRFMFFGTAGRWHDQAHTWREDVFLELPAAGIIEGTHTNPPDGWVGNLVENLGAWYYRGYANENCGVTDQPAWVDLDGDGVPEGHSWAECHPNRDGHVSEPPQDMGAGEQGSPTSGVVEFVGACDSVGEGLGVPPPAGVPASRWGPVGRLTLTPLDGTWGPAPVLVWRDTFSGIRIRTSTFPPSIAGLDIVDLTGTAGPIELNTSCTSGQAYRGPFSSGDMLILPLGNLDEAIELRVAVRVGGEEVTDVDTYAPWGVAL